MGPVYGGKLLKDSLSIIAHKASKEPKPRFETAVDLPTRIEAAETILRAMSLTQDYARLVLLVGHGASVTNNPHASGLQCGACGGYSGDVNARLLASVLNEKEVRAGLVERGIEIPEGTLFVAALHDTTTDSVTVNDRDENTTAHDQEIAKTRN